MPSNHFRTPSLVDHGNYDSGAKNTYPRIYAYTWPNVQESLSFLPFMVLYRGHSFVRRIYRGEKDQSLEKGLQEEPFPDEGTLIKPSSLKTSSDSNRMPESLSKKSVSAS